MEPRDRIRQLLTEQFSGSVIKEENFRNEQTFFVKPDAILDICQALLEDAELKVDYLADLTSVDWLGHEERMGGRFEVVYNLYSISTHYRFFIKVMLPADKPEISSVTAVWPGANWMEREVYDLMGIVFTGHPDLKRILTPDGFEGYPLRRDYPLTYEVPQFSWNKNDPPEVIT
ncbi:MAG TPA: NADH-quinone oxidoreductase subunit C [Candidatus Acidoferrum sp.]|nr:NADH-quinone oxidoreductase subunit C [Candidatus Acidoferrum sp.]